MEEARPERDRMILERILALKQILEDGRGGPVELHDLGICYFLLENYRPAIDTLQKLAADFPGYIESGSAVALRALCYLKTEGYTQAEELIRDRLRVDETDVRLYSMLAFALEKTRRIDDAVDVYRAAHRIAPENLNVLNGLGYLLTMRGRPEDLKEAGSYLKTAVTARPEHPAYLDSFGVLLLRAGNKDAAKKAFGKAVLRAPENQEILDHLKEALDR